jgi:hypothetical protein
MMHSPHFFRVDYSGGCRAILHYIMWSVLHIVIARNALLIVHYLPILSSNLL